MTKEDIIDAEFLVRPTDEQMKRLMLLSLGTLGLIADLMEAAYQEGEREAILGLLQPGEEVNGV